MVEIRVNDVHEWIEYKYIESPHATGEAWDFTDMDNKLSAMIAFGGRRNPTRCYPYRPIIECTNSNDAIRKGQAYIPTTLPNRTPAERRDYFPCLKQSSRIAMATVGNPDDTLVDNGHETSASNYRKWYSGYSDVETAILDASQNVDTSSLPVGLRQYVDIAIRLILSGSDVGAIAHVVADAMVDDFKANNSPIDVTLPETKQRSSDGSLTEDDKKRLQAYDDHIVRLETFAGKFTKLAVKLVQDAETG